MNRVRKRRLVTLLGVLSVLSAALALIFYALGQQADFFYAPSDVVQGAAPENKRMRLGGVVVEGSVRANPQNPMQVSFEVTDFAATTQVSYNGILPDLFTENSGMVAEGELQDGVFVAYKVLAKHDENYMPKEVKKALKEQNQPTEGKG